MLQKFAIVLAVILGYRFLFCLSGLLRTMYYERLYMDYLAGKHGEFASCTAPVKKLFKQAGVTDATVAHVEYVGFDKIRTGNARVTENLAVKREDVATHVLGMFAKAKGTFRMNLLECVSPLYWVQLILFLPVKLCGYLGVDETRAIPKLLQVLYWVSAPLLLIFRTQLYEAVLQLLQQAQ